VSWPCANCRRVCSGAWIVCGGPERFCSSQCSAYFYGTQKRAAEAPAVAIRCRLCAKPMPSGVSWSGAAGPNYYCSKDCEVRFLGIDLGSAAQCGIADCFICGAIRSRAGKGDQS
jgi:hypothetical protein